MCESPCVCVLSYFSWRVFVLFVSAVDRAVTLIDFVFFELRVRKCGLYRWALLFSGGVEWVVKSLHIYSNNINSTTVQYSSQYIT